MKFPSLQDKLLAFLQDDDNEIPATSVIGRAVQRRPDSVRLVMSTKGGTVIDHIVIGVADLAISRSFYDRALEPLGIGVVLDLPGYIGFGDDGRPWFFIASREPTLRVHFAFSARDRATVDAFHAAALAAGAKDNGGPGLRPIYHEHYYGGFVLDPDGNNIEAVCHLPE